MKIKSPNMTPHFLSTPRIKKLGLDWEELLSPSLAIHANRELNMSKIKLVGFDMDYTLAVYKKLPMETLQYNLALLFLEDKLGYPPAINRLTFDQTLLIRGLVIDRHLGNVLKLDDQNHVWRAYYCRQQLTPEQIGNLYGSKRIKVGDERYYSLDTFFSIPEACLFVDVVEFLDERHRLGTIDGRFLTTEGTINYNEIFTHVRYAMDSIHSNGSLKDVIGAHIHEFIVQDAEIEVAIRKLRNDGKSIFLLTNSTFAYTDVVMSYVFGNYLEPNKAWIDLFDLVIVEAHKPSFFTETRGFTICPDAHAHGDKVMVGGNIHEFHRLANVRGQDVLYVGDHIYGDILRSKKDSLWRTCLIIKELNFDIRMTIERKTELKMLKQIQVEQAHVDKRLVKLRTMLSILKMRLQNETIEDPQLLALTEELKAQIKQATSRLQKLKMRHHQITEELETAFHKKWGRLFKESHELTRFGAQVRQYACIYTDHIRNFLHYGANHVFITHREMMTHEFDLD